MGALRWHRMVVSTVLVAALAGCWEQTGGGPDRRAHNPLETIIDVESAPSLVSVWTFTAGAGISAGPIISGSAVAVSTQDALDVIDAATGARRWTSTAPDADIVGSAFFIDGGRLVARVGYPGVGGELWEFDGATGQVLSRSHPGLSATAMRGTTMGGFDPGLRAPFPSIGVFDRVTGAGWRGLGEATAAMTVGVDLLYVPQPGAVSAFTLDRPADCRPPGVQVYVPCSTWTVPLDGEQATPVVIGDGTVYIGTDAGTVYALDAATGGVRWTAAVGAPVLHPPALADGTLFVPTEAGDLVAFHADGCGAAQCRGRWKAPAGGPISEQPAVAGGVVFVGTSSGSVLGFVADGCGQRRCTAIWSATTGSGISGAPAVTGGRLYVGTEDGHVLAFAPAPG